MWKKVVCLFLILSFIITIVGCGGAPTAPPISPEPLILSGEQITNILDSTAQKYNQLTETQGEEIARGETVEWLQKQPNIKQAEIGPDGTTICFTYTDGTSASLITKPLESETEEPTEELLGKLPSTRADMPGNKKAVLLAPRCFGIMVTEPFAKTLKKAREMLEACGYDVTYLEGEDVNLDNLNLLPEYGVILYAGHGTYRIEGGQWIIGWVTNQTCTKQDLDREDIRQARKRGDIGVVIDRRSFLVTGPFLIYRLAVFPSFFTRNGGRYPDSFITSYSCDGLYNDTLAKAFLDLGAAVYCGWTREVFPPVDQQTVRILFDNLTNGETIGEAVAATGDPTFQFRPLSASNFRITELTSEEIELIRKWGFGGDYVVRWPNGFVDVYDATNYSQMQEVLNQWNAVIGGPVILRLSNNPNSQVKVYYKLIFGYCGNRDVKWNENYTFSTIDIQISDNASCGYPSTKYALYLFMFKNVAGFKGWTTKGEDVPYEEWTNFTAINDTMKKMVKALHKVPPGYYLGSSKPGRDYSFFIMEDVLTNVGGSCLGEDRK